MLKEYIAYPLNQHFIVANVRNNSLILEFASATWATNARFMFDDMLQIAKNKFQDIEKIEWYVHPNNIVANMEKD